MTPNTAVSPPAAPASFPLRELNRTAEAVAASNPIRRMAFYSALVVVFLRFSFVHELISYYGGANAYILYVFTIPAMIGLLLGGGLQRTFKRPTMLFWVGFTLWMTAIIPFSVWRGDSLSVVLSYARTVLPVGLMLAGLPMGWKEVRLAIYAIAIAGAVSVISGIAFGSEYGQERVGLEFGTIQNPNDYAGHLLLVLPLIAFLALRPPKILLLQTVTRLACIGVLLVGIYLVVASGSRGAVLAIAGIVIYLFVRFKTTGRMAVLVLTPLLAVGIIPLLPEHTLSRLQSFSDEPAGYGDEAGESARLRRFLLERSVIDTLTHPIFGVGPGQFGNFEGADKEARTKKTIVWINPHNTYTQVSSETGFPGLALYLGGIISCYLLLRRSLRKVQDLPDLKEMAQAIFCLLIGLLAYSIAVAFLNFAYFYYFPALAGLSVCLAAAVDQEVARVAGGGRPQPGNVLSPVLALPQPVGAKHQPGRAVRFNRYR